MCVNNCVKWGVVVTSLILSSAIAQAFSGPVFRNPEGNEIQALGTIKRIDQQNRTILIDAKTLFDSDLNETNYGNPEPRVIRIPTFSRIHYFDSSYRWLSLTELKVGQDIAVFVTPGSDESWSSTQLVIPTSDPKRPLDKKIILPRNNPVEGDDVCMDEVVVPMVFPIAANTRYSDTFLASRGGGTRRHKGQDLMNSKFNPVVAVFDGIISFYTNRGNAGNIITVKGDNGWTAQYFHINNDTPGTDDGKGTEDYAFLLGLKNGDRVYAGQLIGWNGDSGNAEGTGAHVHFELWHDGACYNPYPSLKASVKLNKPVPILPAPDWTGDKGKLRLDGHIRHIDRERNVLILDLWGETPGGTPLRSVTRPAKKYVRVKEDDIFMGIDGASQKSFANLQEGELVSMITTNAPNGQAVNMLEAMIVRPNALVATNTNTPPKDVTKAPKQPKENADIIIELSNPYLDGLAESYLSKINEARRKENLPELTINRTLAKTAQDHADNMMKNDFFSLNNPKTGKSAMQDAVLRGYTGKAQGYISFATSTLDLADSMIIHQQDLIYDKDIKHVGLGHAYLDYDLGKVQHKYYWCILLGK